MTAAAPSIGLVLHPRNDPGPTAEPIVRLASAHATTLLARPGDAGRLQGDVQAVPEDELPDAIGRLESGAFSLEEHSALVVHAGADETFTFNEVALSRVPGDGVVHAELAVGGQRMGRYRGDGLIITTPIGSTAYSYSAGAPVVSPALDAAVVTPVAPMGGISRPMVIPTGEPVRLRLLEDSGRPALEADGAVLHRTDAGEVIDLRLQPGAGQVVRLDPDRHQRRNQVKLSLLDLPFLPDELRELLP